MKTRHEKFKDQIRGLNMRLAKKWKRERRQAIEFADTVKRRIVYPEGFSPYPAKREYFAND